MEKGYSQDTRLLSKYLTQDTKDEIDLLLMEASISTNTTPDFTEDIVTVIKRKLESRNEKPISDELSITDFSEVYLFFDYDFQNKNLELEELNAQLNEMLELFSDETDNGKIYVSYPMIESIKCTQKLPDEHFFEYKASRENCSDFKNYVSTKYTYYKSTDFMQFKIDKKTHELRPL